MSEDPLADDVTLLEVPISSQGQEEPLQNVLSDLQQWCPRAISTQVTQSDPQSLLGQLVSQPTVSSVHKIVGGERVKAFLEETFRRPSQEEPANEALSKKASFVQPSKKRLSHQAPGGSSVLRDLPIPQQPSEISASDSLLKSKQVDRATAEANLSITLPNRSVRLQEKTIRDTILEFSVAEGLVTALAEASVTEELDDNGQLAKVFSDLDPELFLRVCRQLLQIFNNISNLTGSLYANLMLHKRDAFLFHNSFLRACEPLRPALRRDPLSSRSLFEDHSAEITSMVADRTQRSLLDSNTSSQQALQKILNAQLKASKQPAGQSARQSSSRGRGKGNNSGRQQGQQTNSQQQQQHQRGGRRGRGGKGRGSSNKRAASSSSAGEPAEKKQCV